MYLTANLPIQLTLSFGLIYPAGCTPELGGREGGREGGRVCYHQLSTRSGDNTIASDEPRHFITKWEEIGAVFCIPFFLAHWAEDSRFGVKLPLPPPVIWLAVANHSPTTILTRYTEPLISSKCANISRNLCITVGTFFTNDWLSTSHCYGNL